MLDPAHPYMSLYLWLGAATFAVAFVIPLFVAPLRWAKIFRWPVPADNELATYFGQCLGAAGCAIVFGMARAARHPAANPLVFEILIAAGSLLTVVHIVGAFRRKWPWTETAEIPFWAASAIIPALMYRSL
jgi:hypothetical protein